MICSLIIDVQKHFPCIKNNNILNFLVGKLCEVTHHLPVGTRIKFSLKLSTSEQSSPPETVSQTITISELPQAELEIL